MNEATLLDITDIRIDGGTQARAGLDAAIVDEYHILLKQDGFDEKFRPVWPFSAPLVVFYDGSEYWLADGFHRLEACRKASRLVAPADVRAGTRRDAVLFAAGANSSHGLRRTRSDVRRAIQLLLDDPEWSQWSDREIARQVHCDHKTVGSMRAAASGEFPQIRTFSRNGKTYEMDTTAIGSSQDDNGQNKLQQPEANSKAEIVYPSLWELESCVRAWIDHMKKAEWGGKIPDTVYKFTLPTLADRFDKSTYWVSFSNKLPRQWRKHDVVQAIHNVKEQLRQGAEAKYSYADELEAVVKETEAAVMAHTATLGLYLSRAFPLVCPTGKAPVVCGANCRGCEYYRDTDRGTWQCEHPTNLPDAPQSNIAPSNHEYTIQSVIKSIQSLTAQESMDVLKFCKNMQIDEPEQMVAFWRALAAMINYWWGQKAS